MWLPDRCRGRMGRVMRCPYPGCVRDAKPKGRWCGDAHRIAGHKLSVQLGQQLPRERRRTRDRAAKATARAQGVIPSDVRVSFGRAVEVLAAEIEHKRKTEAEYVSVTYSHTPEQEAFEVLHAALPRRLQESV